MADLDRDLFADLGAEEDAETAARLDAEAEANIAAGRVVPHERVVEWLEKLEKGERVPPPRAEPRSSAW